MSLSPASLKRDLLSYARSLGFERAGVTSADALSTEGGFFERWLAEGRAGEMTYLEREPQRRSRPADLLPGAKSVISMAKTYHNASLGTVPRGALYCLDGGVARYAGGRDYHNVLGKKMDALVRYIEAMAPAAECRTFVDTGPLLERAFAQRAGLGFIGKNTMLITKGLGSYVFLASIITTLELPPDAPDERSCGECRLCIDACPTQAITAPFDLDARRCIAYLTIESDKSIPQDLRPPMGGWIFGCDICQEVCPHNTPNRWVPGLRPPGMTKLSEILAIKDDAEFNAKFAGTAMMRAGREGLVRNACVAAGNLGRTDLTPLLRTLSRNDSSPTVREQAAWALETLASERASRVP